MTRGHAQRFPTGRYRRITNKLIQYEKAGRADDVKDQPYYREPLTFHLAVLFTRARFTRGEDS